jgi:phosphomannomutase
MATHSGLRGRPGDDLTPEVVARAVGGLLALLAARRLPASLAVARDERPEGRELVAQVIAAAIEGGADVVDLGMVGTPTAKLAARVRSLGGAVVVTGSHLLPELNGLKLVAAPDYAPVDLRTLPSPPDPSERLGEVRRDDGAPEDHAAAICAAVDAGAIRAAGLRVRCEGGVGATAAAVLERLGCRPGGAHPDVGLRLDADADRLALVDERGRELASDAVLALAIVARGARTVVKGRDTSRVVDALVEARGGAVHVTPPGELHLIAALTETGAEVAGEGNGGVVVPAVGPARDGLAAAAAILELRARARRPLSELAAELPPFAIRRSAVPCESSPRALGALARLAARFGVPAPADPEEGVLLEGGEGTWGLVRLSATEPVLRLTAEAATAGAADALHAELRATLAPPAGT